MHVQLLQREQLEKYMDMCRDAHLGLGRKNISIIIDHNIIIVLTALNINVTEVWYMGQVKGRQCRLHTKPTPPFPDVLFASSLPQIVNVLLKVCLWNIDGCVTGPEINMLLVHESRFKNINFIHYASDQDLNEEIYNYKKYGTIM